MLHPLQRSARPRARDALSFAPSSFAITMLTLGSLGVLTVTTGCRSRETRETRDVSASDLRDMRDMRDTSVGRDAGNVRATARLDATPPSRLAAVPPPHDTRACGDFDCLAFDQPLAAFRYVLAHRPRVLALGEAHAQKGSEGIASSTKRFGDTFLPELRGKASSMVLELWLGEPRCGKVVEVVREQQKAVTSSQAKSNPNEIVALGDRAYALGIRPYPLRPSCDEYAPIADAGADAVPKMLELIARLSEARLRALLAAQSDAGAEGSARRQDDLVLAYGGAMHNDAEPRPGKAIYSFGPAMMEATDGRYVELDLIVGEFVRDAEPWTSLPWVKSHLAQPGALKEKTTLYRVSPASFVLVFPKRP